MAKHQVRHAAAKVVRNACLRLCSVSPFPPVDQERRPRSGGRRAGDHVCGCTEYARGVSADDETSAGAFAKSTGRATSIVMALLPAPARQAVGEAGARVS